MTRSTTPYVMTARGRALRIVGGAHLVALAFFGIGVPCTWIGIFPLAAGAVGWCPFPALRSYLTRKDQI